MHLILGLLFVTLLPAIVVASDNPVYHWQCDVDLPEMTATTPVGIPLDSHFFHATRDGWPDVRVRDDHNDSVAFLIRTARDFKTTTTRQTWAAEQNAAKVDAAIGLQVDLTLRDKDSLPQGIRIITPLRDFEHQVRVEVSSDGQSWTSAGPATLIFDYSRFVDARNDLVPLPSGDHRHFRLTVEDVTAEQESQLLELHRQLSGSKETSRTESTTVNRRPFRIDRIEFYRDNSKAVSDRTQTTDYPSTHSGVTEREKQQQTVLTFDTQREPITQITINTSAENFSRAATIEVESEDLNGKTSWRHLAKGTLTRFSVGTIQRDERTLSIPESRAIHYRVLIENRDSPPLSISGVELRGPLYELTFLASPHQKLTVEYGSPDAKAGRYDVAALQASLSQEQPVTLANWSSPRENQSAPANQVQTVKIWNDRRFLIGSIVALTVLLAWGLFRAAKRIETPPSA